MAAAVQATATLQGRSASLRRSPFRSGSSAIRAQPVLARRAARPQALQTVARAAKKAAETAYICIDCGYLYTGSEGPFEKLPSSYRCPVCAAPKRRFKPYEGGKGGKNDAKSMQARAKALQGAKGSSSAGTGVDKEDSNFLLLFAAGGAVFLGALYFALNSQF